MFNSSQDYIIPQIGYTQDQLNEAIEAAVLAEREACANVCEGIGWGNNPHVNPKAGTTCAAAIRARSND